MKSALDTTVLVAALVLEDPDHEACRKVLLAGRHSILNHALTETFSTLTGGRLGFRFPPADAARLLRQQLSPKFHSVALGADDLLTAFDEAEARGVCGGAIYDYLHLFAARKIGVKRFFTLNLSDFLSFQRPGDPEVLAP